MCARCSAPRSAAKDAPQRRVELTHEGEERQGNREASHFCVWGKGFCVRCRLVKCRDKLKALMCNCWSIDGLISVLVGRVDRLCLLEAGERARAPGQSEHAAGAERTSDQRLSRDSDAQRRITYRNAPSPVAPARPGRTPHMNLPVWAPRTGMARRTKKNNNNNLTAPACGSPRSQTQSPRVGRRARRRRRTRSNQAAPRPSPQAPQSGSR